MYNNNNNTNNNNNNNNNNKNSNKLKRSRVVGFCEIETDQQIDHNKPDIVVFDKQLDSA